MRRIKVNRAEIKEMMDRKERMDMVKKIAAIREAIEETKEKDRRSLNALSWKLNIVVLSWKKYCRESWLYRVLEFIGLR
tara:strand:+ start:1152 stop:1388 length:237 start_codon:yes stop_codon:yes gene_type:complete